MTGTPRTGTRVASTSSLSPSEPARQGATR